MELLEICQNAKELTGKMGTLDTNTKNQALLQVADGLVKDAETILAANQEDVLRGKKNGMPEGLLDRLMLNQARIEQMAEGIRQVAALDDLIGEVLFEKKRPNGLMIGKKRVPLGVVGIIYEARPNVTADAFALCFKTGNVVILKGGSDAISSNIAIVSSIRKSLKICNLPEQVVSLIEDTSRETAAAFMKMNEYVDVLIPRGGAGLIRAVVNQATIPVIETGTGNCHVFVDESADFEMAIKIILNAKTQRIGVCNACESLVIHEKIVDAFMPQLVAALQEKNVEVRADEASYEATLSQKENGIKKELLTKASEADFGTEYLDYKLSVKTVASVDEAIAHINRYNTGHSETIVT
ncbi:MAG: glutamate-5-semialdehyde dehydrogenase, partial [Roseburia sp.]|nr:glutamate-5-semialdehyde dehydrogenase [Roseburia sp.]